MMLRLYLALIMLAVLVVLLFGETAFLFEPKEFVFLNHEISLTSQILLSGVSTLILVFLLLFGMVEKTAIFFVNRTKVEKKKQMATKD